MQEYPDNDQPNEGLDGLFRKSAEEFEPTFDPAAWQDMRARLEEHDRKVLMNKWLIRSSILLAVLLVGFVGWYSWEVMHAGGASVRQQPGQPTRAQNQLPGDGPATGSEQQQPATTETVAGAGGKTSGQPQLPADRTLPNPTASAASELDKVQNGTELSVPRVESPGVESPRKSARKTNNQSITLRTPPLVRPVTESGKRVAPAGLAVRHQEKDRLAGKNDQPQLVRTPAVTDGGRPSGPDRTAATGGETPKKAGTIANPDFDPTAGETAVAAGQDQAVLGDMVPVLQQVEALQSHSFVWPVFTSALVYPVAAPDAEKPAATPRPKLRGFSLRAMVSPDLTTIGLHDFVRPGVNLGLLAEYRLSNRWNVQAGAMWSKKVYEAYPDQYEWPANWKWQVPVLGVDGVCSMVDIPLNIRYDVVLQPRKSGLPPSRWFANAGVTSFVMLREVYDYQYENPHDPRIKFTQWAGKTGTYGLSHLNFSVGYERALTKRCSWQIEPFIKTPLQGVGRFKVNLISTGTFLSIRYKL